MTKRPESDDFRSFLDAIPNLGYLDKLDGYSADLRSVDLRMLE